METYKGALFADSCTEERLGLYINKDLFLGTKITDIYTYQLDPAIPFLRKKKMHVHINKQFDHCDFVISLNTIKNPYSKIFYSDINLENIKENIYSFHIFNPRNEQFTFYCVRSGTLEEFIESIYLKEYVSFIKIIKEFFGIFSEPTRDTLIYKGMGITVESDKLFLFDNYICDISNKGRILTAIDCYWFGLTKFILPNYLIYFKDNVKITKIVKRIPIEFVVRGYLTGSLYQKYRSGERNFPFGKLPESLQRDQRLPYLAITPLLKGDYFTTPISKSEIPSEYPVDLIYSKIKELFTFGELYSKMKGLILVNTKYEFGLGTEGLVLIDSLHNPDNSRYWNTFNELITPSEDSRESGVQWSTKDKIRDFLGEIPYRVINFHNLSNGKIMDPQIADSSNSFCNIERPKNFVIPQEQLTDNSVLYQEFYRKLTGTVFDISSTESYCKIVNNYFDSYSNKVIVLGETSVKLEYPVQLHEQGSIKSLKKLLSTLEKIQTKQQGKYILYIESEKLASIVAANLPEILVFTSNVKEPSENLFSVSLEQFNYVAKKLLT